MYTFNHFWMSGLARGHNQPYGDYCLELVAAEQVIAHLPDNSLNYAFHLDSAQYARFLRELSEANGAVRREGKIGEVHLDPETGNIASITMEDGGEVPGDFILIDCTGFRALLIGQALGTDYDDWSHYLPLRQRHCYSDPIGWPAHTLHALYCLEAGWQWRIPLQHRTGNGIVYCSKYISQDEALQKISDTVEGEKLTDPNFIKFRTGARQKQWVKNCVAVGLSSGFMEPLESTSIHLIQRNILRLIQLMPNGDISERDIDQFNKQAEWDMETIRDFLILHYVANERTEPFWTYYREMQVPDKALQHEIELFRETGRVFRENEELFAENSWIQVMMGQGIVPKAYHPLADKMSDKELEYFLSEIRSRVAKTVSSLPPHDTYVKQYCPTNDVI